LQRDLVNLHFGMFVHLSPATYRATHTRFGVAGGIV
jgi:hypothetical protein